MLFNTFDKSLVEKTQNMAEIIKRKIKNLMAAIKELAKFYFKDSFINDNVFDFFSCLA